MPVLPDTNVPTPLNLNNILRVNGVTTLNNSLPAAPGGNINVTWAVDEFGNISASAPSSVSPSGGTITGNLTVTGTVAAETSTVTPDVVLTGATPTVTAGQIGLGTSVAATATGGAGTLPSAPVNFLEINIAGTVYKIPLYNV